MKKKIPGHGFFGKIFVLEKTGILPYILGRNPKKEGLYFDSLCNGCISAQLCKE
jgi:hypothetical protein